MRSLVWRARTGNNVRESVSWSARWKLAPLINAPDKIINNRRARAIEREHHAQTIESARFHSTIDSIHNNELLND